MKTKKLGTQGLEIPLIGLGCMGMSPSVGVNTYGKADETESIATIHHSLEMTLNDGLPTVQYFAERLHMSPNYLSDMLRVSTGQGAQGHIQNKVIEAAKTMLSTSNLTVAEIAYQLGFERPQSLNRLFKSKMNISPLEYRASFN